MKFLKKLFKYIFFILILGGVAAAAGLVYVYQRLEPELPSIEVLRDVRLQVPLRVYSRDGKLIAEFGEKRRIPLTYEEIPDTVRQAFLAAEDDRFFQHPGVDYQGLVRAAVQLALTGERRQGGSTITMQVARNFFLSPEQTYKRKVLEI
jgi:penicillin-binding protein 1A